MPPAVSINLCCYNGEKYLEETLQSIFAQTYKDWELVIINDGSTDSTEKIIKKYISLGRSIVYHYQENAGLGAARNMALELSSGSIIAFIDQDDLWLPEKLEKQVPLFDAPDIGLVYCDTIFFNQKGENQRFYHNRPYWKGWCFSQMLSGYFLSLETVVIRRSALEGLEEWFDPRFSMIEEADLFRRIAYSWKLDMVNEPLAKWRVHFESLTWKKGHLLAEETKKMIDKFSTAIPDFKNKYASEIDKMNRNILIDTAFYLWNQGQGKNCRSVLRPYIFKNKKMFVVYWISCFLPGKYFLKIVKLFRPQTIIPS